MHFLKVCPVPINRPEPFRSHPGVDSSGDNLHKVASSAVSRECRRFVDVQHLGDQFYQVLRVSPQEARPPDREGNEGDPSVTLYLVGCQELFSLSLRRLGRCFPYA